MERSLELHEEFLDSFLDVFADGEVEVLVGTACERNQTIEGEIQN